jgi:hypothetical protein
MRQRWLFLSVPLAAALLGGTAMYLALSSTSRANNNIQDKKAGPALPIRQVVLFNSGVGYFQREGDVDGNAHVELTFPVGDVNDLLKSLVLQDAQGRVGTVSYDSQDPVDKILRSFALDLNNNPSFAQILNQARGEKIEITYHEKKDGPPAKLTGVIVGMEVQRRPAGKDQVVEVEILNLHTTAGLQSLPLELVLSVRFLNPLLESEFQRALQVLAASHDTQKKTVSIGFNGAGKRPVRVGYVVERPIWKTSYRLRLEPAGKIALQGWAIVENTSDDDWNDVRMVLVSGRPISYKMNLYEPLYIPRPTVEPELFASLRPPVYSSGIYDQMTPEQKRADNAPLNPMLFPGLVPNQPNGQGGAPLGMVGAGPPPAPVSEGSPPGTGRNLGGIGGGIGGIGGMLGGGMQMQGGVPGNRFQPQPGAYGFNINGNGLNPGNGINPAQPDRNRLTFEELQQRREQQRAAQDEAKKAGVAITGFNFKEGIASVATAGEVGDYYQYVIDQRISLARQKSALLPILDQSIMGEKVSIYNESVQAKYPLLGLRLKNTSGKPLTQGPITVYDEGTYAGDTRILDLQPGEERLLSYALDQGTEVKTDTKRTPSPDMYFKIGADKLTAQYKLRETKTYTIHNRSPHDRLVILEHPRRGDWKLVEPAKAAEETRDVYRFQVKVAASKTLSVAVAEDQARVDAVALMTKETPLYPIVAGVNVKVDKHQEKEKLVGLKIRKGLVLPTYLAHNSLTYLVQNLSAEDRNFRVDHVIHAGWVRVPAEGKPQPGPDVFRFQLAVAKGKTGQQEVVEERKTEQAGKLLKDLGAEKLREYLASPAASAALKESLQKDLAMETRIAETSKELAEAERHLKALGEDQTRLRENLKIIPQSADPYKRFLDKFVAQETEIEGLQRQVRQVTATLQAQEREYMTFLAILNVD